jgi:hypothetical protein
MKTNVKDKPMVVAVRNSKQGTTLVVAVLGQAREVQYSRK